MMKTKTKFYFVLFLLILIFSRILYLFYFGVPLGYDSGLYKNFYEHSNLEFSKGEFYHNSYLDNVFLPNIALIASIFLNIGFKSSFLIYFLPIFFEILIFFNLFIFTKKLFSEKIAIYTIGFYALSIVGYLTYWFNYQKNLLGISLILFIFYLLYSKKYVLASVSGGFLGGLHRPSFALFSSIFFFDWIDNRKRKIFFSGILILVLTSLFYLNRIYLIEEIIMKTSNSIGSSSSGTFLSLKTFFKYNLLFIPFIITGIFVFFKSKNYTKNNILLIWLVLSVFLISLRLFFFNRYLIFLNILLIIFAGIGFNYFSKKFKNKIYFNLGKVIYLSLCLIFLFSVILKIQPLINNQEIEGLNWLEDNSNLDTYVAYNDRYYMPWVYGWSKGKVISHKNPEFNYINFSQIFNGDFSQLNNSRFENKTVLLFLGKFSNFSRYDYNKIKCFEEVYKNSEVVILKKEC